MELEYKWKLPASGLKNIVDHLNTLSPEVISSEEYKMCSAYYDTDDRMFTKQHGALRLREENGKKICCVKRSKNASGACTAREEYEVPADSVQEGLFKLCDSKLGLAFCMIVLNRHIIQLCKIDFTRMAYLLRFSADGETCEGELAVDQGTAVREAHSVPISEVEFEFKSGSETLFHKCAEQIRALLSLEPQPLSKLAQIMQGE